MAGSLRTRSNSANSAAGHTVAGHGADAFTNAARKEIGDDVNNQGSQISTREEEGNGAGIHTKSPLRSRVDDLKYTGKALQEFFLPQTFWGKVGVYGGITVALAGAILGIALNAAHKATQIKISDTQGHVLPLKTQEQQSLIEKEKSKRDDFNAQSIREHSERFDAEALKKGYFKGDTQTENGLAGFTNVTSQNLANNSMTQQGMNTSAANASLGMLGGMLPFGAFGGGAGGSASAGAGAGGLSPDLFGVPSAINNMPPLSNPQAVVAQGQAPAVPSETGQGGGVSPEILSKIQEFTKNPEALKQFTSTPEFQKLMNDPAALKQLQSYPEVQKLLNNPQISQTLREYANTAPTGKVQNFSAGNNPNAQPAAPAITA
jgi:hypothetical protein